MDRLTRVAVILLTGVNAAYTIANLTAGSIMGVLLSGAAVGTGIAALWGTRRRRYRHGMRP